MAAVLNMDKKLKIKSRKARVSGKRTLMGLGLLVGLGGSSVRALIRTAGGHWPVTCLYNSALASANSNVLGSDSALGTTMH